MNKRKMTVAKIGITFGEEEQKKDVYTTSFNFPEGTELLSISFDTDEKTVLWIHFMSPSEKFDGDYNNIEFIIAKCKYAEIEIDRHKHIGTFDIDETSYEVFAKTIISVLLDD